MINNTALRMPPAAAVAAHAAARPSVQLAVEAAAQNAELWSLLWQLTTLVYARQCLEPPPLADLASARKAIRTMATWLDYLRPCADCDTHPVPWDADSRTLCPRCSYEASRDEWDDREGEDRDFNSGCWSPSW